MPRSISRLLSILAFVFCATASTSAQDSCPILTISGPMGTVNVGDIATYTASLDHKGSPVTPTFRWTTSVGEIVSGQGTRTIEVRQPNACITATVEVEGFPDACPLTASETSCGDPPSQAIRIGEMSNASAPDLELIRLFREEQSKQPGIYILRILADSRGREAVCTRTTGSRPTYERACRPPFSDNAGQCDK